MADAFDGDNQNSVLDGVNYSIIANPNSERILTTDEFATSVRAAECDQSHRGRATPVAVRWHRAGEGP